MYKIVVTGLSDFYPSKLFKCFFPESCAIIGCSDIWTLTSGIVDAEVDKKTSSMVSQVFILICCQPTQLLKVLKSKQQLNLWSYQTPLQC